MNPLKVIGKFFQKVSADIQGAITEGVEHGEAEVMDMIAGVVEDFDVEPVINQFKADLIKAIEDADFGQTADVIKERLIEALNQRAEELRK